MRGLLLPRLRTSTGMKLSRLSFFYFKRVQSEIDKKCKTIFINSRDCSLVRTRTYF